MKEIKTLPELIEFLSNTCAAYRKSYKLMGRLNTLLMVTTGILTSTAVLAIVPTIPVFIAAAGAIPVITGVISSKARLGEKKAVFKQLHKEFKQFLSYCMVQKDDIVTDVFEKILLIQKSEHYTEPLEMYIRMYKLNGY